jgi:hypothetical protein
MSLTTTKYHLDFLYGIDSHTLVYPQVLKNMRNMPVNNKKVAWLYSTIHDAMWLRDCIQNIA